MTNDTIHNEHDSLDLQDLLLDEGNDVLSEYLSISLESMGSGTKVSVTTVEDEPATYASVLQGVTLTDLHCLVDIPIDL